MANGCAWCIVNAIGWIVLKTGKGLWILTKLGFTVVGVAAGSLAALAMSAIGNVQAGSVIAQSTSAGMRAMWYVTISIISMAIKHKNSFLLRLKLDNDLLNFPDVFCMVYSLHGHVQFNSRLTKYNCKIYYFASL